MGAVMSTLLEAAMADVIRAGALVESASDDEFYARFGEWSDAIDTVRALLPVIPERVTS
jgi:hypothetical protein